METVKIFRSYRDAAKMLETTSVEEAYRFLMALLDYGLDGVEPELDGPAKAMFVLTKPNLDASIKKATGNIKGGSQRKSNGSQTEVNSKSTEVNGKSTLTEEGSRKKEVGSRRKEVGSEKYTPQKPPTGGVTERFAQFWEIYPNKTGKQAAWKTWSRLKPSAELTEVILAAVEYQKTWEKWTKEGGRYIPNPATWLGQGRWEDEQTAAPTGGSGDGYRLGPDELSAVADLERLRDSFANAEDGGG